MNRYEDLDNMQMLESSSFQLHVLISVGSRSYIVDLLFLRRRRRRRRFVSGWNPICGLILNFKKNTSVK